MKRALTAASLLMASGALGLLLVPFLAATVVAGEAQAAGARAAYWDVPPAVLPALEAAGDGARIPWFLLAGVASVATDYAQRAPDGVVRGSTTGTAVFPVVIPPIRTPGGGAGMFLVVATAPGTVGPGLGDPQDVAAAAQWLARQLAIGSAGSPLAAGPLSDPLVAQFWARVLASAPLDIVTPAPTGPPATPAVPGANPIQQFGAAVLGDIAAPSTVANLGAFSAWAAGEGTCAHFNPLATTEPEAGAVAFNTLSDGGHVWNYPSFGVGVQATATALTNGLYQPVITAFRLDAGVAAVAAAVERSPWGTRHFGSPSFAGLACSNDGSSALGSAAPPLPTLPEAAGPGAVATTIVARAALYQEIWDQAMPTAP